MSRIADALRRVAEGDGGESERSTPADVPVRPADDVPFESYPAEGQGGPHRPDGASLRPVVRRASMAAGAPRAGVTLLNRTPATNAKLIVSPEASAASVAEYRRLADALQDIQNRSVWEGDGSAERGLKTLLVTSARNGEGRTLTAVNLALTLSRALERRVLLIDGDVRRPAVHELLELPNTAGLLDVLRSGRPGPPLHEVSPFLSVMSAGRGDPDPGQDLASDRMRAVLDACSPRFDWIVVDGPPVGLLPESRDGAHVMRAVLFVIGSRTTLYEDVAAAIATLGRGCIVGTVLNRVADY